MTRKEIESEKKEFITFIVMGILMHIVAIYMIIAQFIPEVTTAGILKAIFFGILITGVFVAYWINMSRYAKAIKKAEKKLENK